MEEKLALKSPVIEREDGTISISATTNSNSSVNFAYMLTSLLATNNVEDELTTNLDMKVIKDTEDPTKVNIIYGNFSVEEDERQLSEELTSKINEAVSQYDSNTDYKEKLEATSPSLALTLDIVYANLLDREGQFQMAIRNNGNTHDMVLGLDENYEDVVEVFSDNGVMVSSGMDNSIVHMNNIEYLDQRLVLTNVKAGLSLDKTKGYQLTKTIGRSANVTSLFLEVVTAANIALFFVYCIMKVYR